MKNALAVLIAFFLPQLALAQTTTADGFVYTVSGSAVTITGYTGSGGAITIPAAISGVPVTAIGSSAFSGKTTITGVIIPSSVNSIGSSAFSSCTALNGVTIPSGMTSIGTFAFYKCTALTGVTIRSGVTNIGQAAFLSCTDLASITVDASNPAYASDGKVLFNKTRTKLIQAAPAGVSGSYTIPSSVTSIEIQAFSSCTALTGVTIPSSVTSIGFGAFENCTALTGGTIPASVTSIGQSAFYNCTALTGVTIPSSLTTIGISAFRNCTALASITVDASNPAFASDGKVLFDKTLTTLIQAAIAGVSSSYTIPSSVTSIGSSAFSYCTALTGVTIPSSVTSIGSSAFNYCTALTGVTIPSSVTSIGTYAFYNCTVLASITVDASNPAYASDGKVLFNKTRTTLIQAAPSGASGSYTIPSSVTSIGQGAFLSCTGLTGVTIPSSVTSIGSSAFSYCTALTGVTIPSSVTSIGTYAFQGCTALTGVTIPSSVTSIGSYAFYNCTTLATIAFMGNAPTEGSNAFVGTSLPKVYYLPTTTGWGATFSGIPTQAVASTGTTADGFAYSLVGTSYTITGYTGSGGAITIPAAISGVPVTAIGNYAFGGKTTVTGVIIPSSVTSIGSDAFWNCTALTSVTIPSSVTSIGIVVFLGCPALASITVDASNPAYASAGNVLFNKTQTTLIYAAPKGVSGSYTIPSSVTSIGTYAFSSCTALTGVTIPSSVTSIGSNAFGGCTALTSVTIPSSVTSIGSLAFFYCTALASIMVDVNNTAYASDGKVLFNKTLTTLIKAAPKGVSGSYTIPSSVTSIGTYAFDYCTALTGVTIPSSVTSIEQGAFYYCTKLATLAFMGNAPTEGSNAFAGTALTKVYYLPTATGWGATFSGIPTQAVASTGTTADGFAYSLVGTSYTITGYTGSGGAITIPAAISGVPVTTIGDSAFISKTTITGIVIPESVISIGQSCFSGCANLASISLGAGVTNIASTAFIFLGKLTNISVASNNVAFSSSADGRALFNKSKSRIVKYASGVAGSYSIPIGVTELGPYSFFYASGLTEIVIPNGVTWINDHVFTGCTSIASLTIPATVDRISCCQSFSSATLNKILFLGNKPTTGGISSDFTGSGITAIHYAENATGWGATFAGYPTVAVKPTSITAPPASVSIVSGDRAELSIAATGAAPLTFQWYQGSSGNTTAPISGATSATFLTTALTTTTSYWVRITDAYGFFSYGPTATVTVSATSPLTVTHNVVGAGYQAGGGVIVTNIITYTGTAPAGITWDTLLPKGWTYLGSGGSEGSATKPTYKTGDLLEWTWTTVPASPFEFTYIASVPAGTTGDQVLVSLVTSQQSGTANQTMAKPDPLVIRSASMHSADVNRDGRIGLLELTRVIELYNYRSGTARTGQYHIQSGTEDGFGTGP